MEHVWLLLEFPCFQQTLLLLFVSGPIPCSKRNIKKLQLVQNLAARIVLGLKKFDHISQGIKSLKLATC